MHSGNLMVHAILQLAPLVMRQIKICLIAKGTVPPYVGMARNGCCNAFKRQYFTWCWILRIWKQLYVLSGSCPNSMHMLFTWKLKIEFRHWLDSCTFSSASLLTRAAHALDTSPAHTCKEALPVASNSRLAILHTTEQAKEVYDEFQSPTCTFTISIATAKLPAWSHHVRTITQ